MTPTPAYPGRDTPKSYEGREVRAVCPECGHRAYLPPWSIDGRATHCTDCERLVEWRPY